MFSLIYKYEGHISHEKFETEDAIEKYMFFQDIYEGYVIDLKNSKIGFASYRFPSVSISWEVV